MNLSQIDAKLRYTLLRFSIEDYHCLPQQLSSKQVQQLVAHLTKAQWIEGYVARQSHREITDLELASAKQTLKEKFASEQEFAQACDSLQLDEDQLNRSLKQAMQADDVLHKVRSSVAKPSEEVLLNFYHQHPEQFIQGETLKLRHILRTINEDFSDNAPENLWPWMNQLAHTLQTHPDQFSKKALEISECPSALQEGQLGVIHRGQLYPELEAPAFALSDNQVSDPVESPMGIHILWCEEHMPEQSLEFDEIKEALCSQMWQEQQKQAERQYMTQVIGGKLPQ